METREEQKNRHANEIKELQNSCLHQEVSDWSNENWAFGHSTGFEIKFCRNCEKVIARRTHCSKCGKLTEEFHDGLGTHSRPYGSHYCSECIVRTPEEVKLDDEDDKRIHSYLKKFWKHEKLPEEAKK